MTDSEIAEKIIVLLLNSRGKPYVVSREKLDSMADFELTYEENRESELLTLWFDKKSTEE